MAKATPVYRASRPFRPQRIELMHTRFEFFGSTGRNPGFARRISALLAISALFLGQKCFSANETDTYRNWQATAKTTQLGQQLLSMMNAVSRAISVNPSDKYSLFRRAYLYGTIGCTESALADLTRVIAIDPSFAAAYTERANCYMDLKNYERALFDLNRAIVLDPRSGDALYTRGRLMLLMNKPSLALNDLRRSQSGECKYSPALPGELPANHYDAADYYLGVAYEAMDKKDEAIRHYQASIKTPRLGSVGFIHRYADQPLDAKYRVSMLESGY